MQIRYTLGEVEVDLRYSKAKDVAHFLNIGSQKESMHCPVVKGQYPPYIRDVCLGIDVTEAGQFGSC